MRFMITKWLGDSLLIGRIAVAVYISMLIFIIGYGYYVVPYVLFLISFLFIVVNLSKLKFFKLLEQRPLIQKLLLVFLIALLLRFLLLFQDQVITRDIVMYAQRYEMLRAGKIPYLDFAVNKPPLYAYLLQFIGNMLGGGVVQFRAFFSILDAVVTVFVFYLCLVKYNEKFSYKASFIYAICPLPIIAIGLSGHYEPAVMIFVLLSVILLLKNRYNLSALCLGISFALKFFPIVLLPFFAWKINSWHKRFSYILLFSLPILISVLPIVLMTPEAFWKYLNTQFVSWTAKKSFAFSIQEILGATTFLNLKISLLISALFLGLIFFMFVSWVRKRFNVTFWFKIIIIIFAVYYGLFITASIKFYHSELGLNDPVPTMLAFAFIYFFIVAVVAYNLRQHSELKIENREEFYILVMFALIFLLFGSNQYNPWYVLWFLPFLLAVKNVNIKLILLLLVFWNFEGLGISLLPGLVLT